MRNSRVKKTALVGMLFALAMVLSFFEGSLAPAMGLPPGVKPGLANIVVMFAFFCIGKGNAAALVVLKALFGMLTRGFTAGALSLGGGIVSLLILIALCSFKKRTSLLIISSCSAMAHNIGQLLVLRFFIASNYTLYYLPVLLISGLIMGIVTSISLNAALPALGRLGFKLEK